jgi:glutathione S-transferase
MDLELISFKLCPYVQRVVITLLHRALPFRMTFVDLDDPPPWFLDVSPFGKVPLLRVDGTVLFESAVINEFVDEVAPGPAMLPGTPLERAVSRAWVELASACLVDHSDLVAAADDKAFKRTLAALKDKLERLEEQLGEGPYFHGAALALVDTAFAPLFMRLEILRPLAAVYESAQLPRVGRWSQALLAVPAVGDSVVPEFRELYLDDIRRRRGVLASRLAERA